MSQPCSKQAPSRPGSGRWIWLAATLLAAEPVGAGAPAPLADHPGFKDPATFTRIPGYFLAAASSFVEKQFEAYLFHVTDGKKEARQSIEGHYYQYYYYFDRSRGPVPSALQVIRNYQAAAARIGGKVLHEQVRPGSALRTTLLLARGGRETWAEVQSGDGSSYYLRIVERQAMEQQVSASADALQQGLAQTGHVEVPGILFDFGKAEVKPESEPALAEVAKVLAASPALELWVVGHTDYVGGAEANVTLSRARAAAVVQALVARHRVDAGRLAPFGAGPYAPVASNVGEEGRARNRRVELVARPER
jgi:OmpA-OmpF porin, OOP family